MPCLTGPLETGLSEPSGRVRDQRSEDPAARDLPEAFAGRPCDIVVSILRKHFEQTYGIDVSEERERQGHVFANPGRLA